jgi:hypothetical protein
MILLFVVGFVVNVGATVVRQQHSADSFDSSPTDPCAVSPMVRGVPMSLDAALRCYDSIPFDAARRDAIVDLLTRAMQLYSFLDIAVAPPPPFEAVDLLAELATIRRTTFASDLRMHLALSDVFRKLRDAHTSYHVPACFQSPIYNALPLFGFAAADGSAKVGALNGMKVFEDTNPRLNFFRNVIERTESVYANFSARVEGATVLQIDGLNPWLALSAFARDSVGVAKSSETRLSLTLTRALPNSTALGAWTARSLFATGIPPPGTVVTLMEANATSPTVYKLPFFLVPGANVSSVADLTTSASPTRRRARCASRSTACRRTLSTCLAPIRCQRGSTERAATRRSRAPRRPASAWCLATASISRSGSASPTLASPRW